MTFKHTWLLAGIISLLLSPATSGADEHEVPYPDGYRHWSHVKSMLIEPGHPLENPFQGIHHVYANDKAIQGYKDGKFPDGSVLVFDLLDYVEEGDTIQEGDRKLVGVMHKDAKKYAETGGWGFEGFTKSSETERLTNDGGVSCYVCHTPQEDHDYVYSRWRD